MSRKATIFARIKERYTSVHPPKENDTPWERDTLLDGASAGITIPTDRLDTFLDHDRFLVTADGFTLERYADDRGTSRGYKMSDLGFRILLSDWATYAARRGTYRGTNHELLWRMSTLPVLRSPIMSIASKTGTVTPLGTNTCAIKQLGVRFIYYAPSGITNANVESLIAKLVPVHLHWSARRLLTSNLIGGIAEVAVVQELASFAGSKTRFVADGVDGFLVPVLTPSLLTAIYTSGELTLPVAAADIDEYEWYVDWRDYQGHDLGSRLVMEIAFYDGATWGAYTTVVLGQDITSIVPLTCTKLKYRATLTASGASVTQNVGTLLAGATTLSGTCTIPFHPCDLSIHVPGGEAFYDHRGIGVLTGSAGGSGTINYISGAFSLALGGASGGGTATALYFRPYALDAFSVRAVHWQVH